VWSKYRVFAFCERLQECRHALLPLLFPDHRKALELRVQSARNLLYQILLT